MKTVCTVLVLVALIALVVGGGSIPENVPQECKKSFEHYEYCEPCGAKKCGDAEVEICTLECRIIPGCYCDKGYLRNTQGECIKKEECPGSR